jgi:CRP-like cAMP-binding protein
MALDDDVYHLARNSAFAELEPEALRLLAFSAETRILRAGDVLFRRGEMADCGFVVLSGSIALTAQNDGRAAEYVLGPQSLIGDLAMIAETRRPAMAVARESTSVLKISRTLFHRILQTFPQSAERLRRQMEKNLLGFVAELRQAPDLKL